MFTATTCAGCNQPGFVLCDRCRFSLSSAPSVLSAGGVLAAVPFEGVGRQVVLALKYRNHRRIARVLAEVMVQRWSALGSDPVDVVTWAPTGARRAGERGFDQAEVLARAVARRLGVPCRRMLYRTHGAPQTGRSRAERLQGPGYRGRSPRSGLRVLLIDDVVTTGATLEAARRSLLDAGVGEVVALAVAATPGQGQAQWRRPAQLRTVVTAGIGSSSTTTASIPTDSAAVTLVGTSSRNAERAGSAPSLSRAS